MVCALLVLGALAGTAAQAACSDKTLRAMADAGRSVSTIAKRCGMSPDAVKDRLAARDTRPARAPAPAAEPAARAAPSATAPAPSPPAAAQSADVSKAASKPAAEPAKHPPGTVLELCGCYGSTPYGFTEANDECLSGKAVATRCPGYCPVNRSPWRRICS
ncbi:hypothetical protein KYC_14377 [Achromobacter arsenitoxydans SY8]|uniref:Uncharacterized protein n=1 Tax=Achromobacter arsenitoxydans SY8 TaxID=477184 RepID=H0F7X7_9BURK|nr:hypothetical protein KYC_14377 [Achromobacter arsenitoxydans SY8]